jgi:hypothetical protein
VSIWHSRHHLGLGLSTRHAYTLSLAWELNGFGRPERCGRRLLERRGPRSAPDDEAEAVARTGGEDKRHGAAVLCPAIGIGTGGNRDRPP